MSQNKPKNSISSSVHEIWCCFHEYGAAFSPSPPAPVAPQPHPYLAPCWVSPGLGSADGRAPLWGPRLWQLVKGPRGSARLSLISREALPPVCRNCGVGNMCTHTHALMDSAYQAGPWDPPASHSAKPQQLERLKPPHVSKRKSSRRKEGGIEEWEKKRRKKYIFMFAGDVCLAVNSPRGCHWEGEERK